MKSPSSRYPAMGDSNVYTADHLIPLYSGLYALQFTLHGGKLAHSGAVATHFHELLRRGPHTHPISHGRPVEVRNRSEPDGSTVTDPNTGLLLVWVHMSDGTSILWNRLKEVSHVEFEVISQRI
ncbi:unnamed protein product [Echinostoma caproni]|uniref:Peptidase A1 domain-containing protein n=1 Tax=Echinostoma caproni TaxID=27848 RepID=A0A183BEE8_9TREM|nr:unnamed protein product [Echinostoma caproni]